MIRFKCTKCGQDMDAPEDLRGQKLPCSKCNHRELVQGPNLDLDSELHITVRCPKCEKTQSIPASRIRTWSDCQFCKKPLFNAEGILLCDGCGKKIGIYGYILNDNKIICDLCLKKNHPQDMNRLILPTHPPENTIEKIQCPACSMTMWVRLTHFNRKINCLACKKVIYPNDYEISLLKSIKLAVWILAIPVIIAAIIALIALLVKG